MLLGCSGDGSTTCTADGICTSDNNGPLTTCAHNTKIDDAQIGATCEKDEDCGEGTCMLPGGNGNITNNVFGYCTRACNCNDDKTLSVESSDATRSCVYPGGCFPGQGASAYRHLIPKCANLDDCLAIDSRYTHCDETNDLTTLDTTCGHLHKVCQAHKP